MQVYLSVERAAKQDWKTILGEPKKPANWKDETYHAKKAELELKQFAEAPEHLAAGFCPRASLIIDKTPAVVDAGSPTVTGLTVHDSPKAYMVTGSGDDIVRQLYMLTVNLKGERLTVVGLNTLETLRQLAWAAAANYIMVPSWVWNAGGEYNAATLVNLYSCSGAKTDTDMTVDQFVAYWADATLLDVICQEFKVDRPCPAQMQVLAVKLMAARLGL